ncbi:hypothetical protein TNCV_3342351 [Trichonephila clavipes]|nr:hypothetical protein TNCV_3342351 [Trichonephila clavipes]
MSPTGKATKEHQNQRIRWDRKRGRRASAEQKYNESRLVDHARFNDETDNENHNDEIINGESIPIYSFIVLKIFIYDGLSREEIAAIANILKTDPASTVQLLHKIVNDEPYCKSSRKETELRGKRKELSEHIFKNLSDLASLKNNFTEQLTDDEDEDSAPFSLESTNDANKQPLTRQFILPSPQDVFVPLPQTQRNQSQREMRKTVKIKGYDFDALIDTGSTIAFNTRKCVHQILGRPTLNPTKINLASFGKVCLQHFGFSFAVVSSFSGWPTVKLKALLHAPIASPLERGNVPDGGKERRRNIRIRIRWDRKRGRRASAEQ